MTSISLAKGQNIDLTKGNPSLTKIRLGLGWDPAVTTGTDFDLDASAIRRTATGLARGAEDLVFYNQLKTPDGSVVHSGDDRTGGNSNDDDEIITVDLNAQPADIQSIVFVATIHEAAKRGQTFGQVSNAFIRVVDDATGRELAKFDLTEDGGQYTSMSFAEVYRHGGEWKFRALGTGSKDDIGTLFRSFGLPA